MLRKIHQGRNTALTEILRVDITENFPENLVKCYYNAKKKKMAVAIIST